MRNAVAIMLFSVLFVITFLLSSLGYCPGWVVNAVIFSVGIYVYLESFNVYRRLRAIRDTATSKIGSLTVGLVEVYGKAKCFSGLFDIYHYLSIKEISLAGLLGINARDSLRALPFYIEDETGIVCVDPMDAEIIVDAKTWTDDSCIYREAEIKEDDYVYCIGTAWRKNTADLVSEINEAVKEAKKSDFIIERFDTDNDGKISQHEWEAARKTIEKEVISKNLNSEKNGIINIGKGRDNPVFIISNKKENLILRKYYVRTILLLLAGIAITAYSFVAVFRG